MVVKWDERYAKSEYFYGTEPNSFLRENAFRIPPGSQVLCLAEGEGRNAVYLAKLGHKVTAVDFSAVGLEKLSKLAKENQVQVTTICCDLRDFVFEEGKWGAIVSIWCHTPSELRRKIHHDVVRALRPIGIFILESYTPEQIKFKTGGPQDADLMPTQAQLETELSGLKPLLKQEIQRQISEGIGHHGMSAVVQFIGTPNAATSSSVDQKE